MDLVMKLLADARAADVERSARSRRIAAPLAACRRWILGIVPRPARQSCTGCCA